MRARLLLRFLLAAWLTVLGGLTVLRNAVWSTPVRLWLEAVEQSPDVWVPHLMLGEAFHDSGALDQALAEYRMAIGLRPTEQVPYMKLGLCLAEMRRLDEADGTFQKLEQTRAGFRRGAKRPRRGGDDGRTLRGRARASTSRPSRRIPQTSPRASRWRCWPRRWTTIRRRR